VAVVAVPLVQDNKVEQAAPVVVEQETQLMEMQELLTPAVAVVVLVQIQH
jgi:hypothetical protein